MIILDNTSSEKKNYLTIARISPSLLGVPTDREMVAKVELEILLPLLSFLDYFFLFFITNQMMPMTTSPRITATI